MKKCWVLVICTLLLQSSPVLAQDGRFAARARQFRQQQQNSNSMDWDLINKPGVSKSGSQLGSSKLFSDTPQNSPGRRMNLPNDSSRRFSRPDGSVFERSSDGTRTLRHANGKESIINPDGSGTLSNGNRITKNAVTNSTTMMRPDGLGFETNADGSKVFKRSNGLETVKTPDGKVYMRDSKTKQPTGRELIK